MGSKLGWAVFLLFAAFALGVGSAGGRSLATTTVTVEVIGKGTVTSNSPNSGIKCGNGKKTCFLTFTSSSTITLAAAPASGWSFDSWSSNVGGDCATPGGNACDLSGAGNHQITASFTGPPTTTSTLSVSYDSTNGDGHVTGPEHGGAGSVVDCGSIGPTTACSW